MTLVGAEYQFDRHKLTFFFQADRRIDFRELVRDLFSVYVARARCPVRREGVSRALIARPSRSRCAWTTATGYS